MSKFSQTCDLVFRLLIISAFIAVFCCVIGVNIYIIIENNKLIKWQEAMLCVEFGHKPYIREKYCEKDD